MSKSKFLMLLILNGSNDAFYRIETGAVVKTQN